MKSTVFLLALFVMTPVLAKYNVPHSKQCDCDCSKNSDNVLCQRLFDMEKIMRTVVKAIEERTYLINREKDFSEWMEIQKEITENLTAEIQLLKDRVEKVSLPSPAALVMDPGDPIERESEVGSGALEDEKTEISKEVSILIAKVEEVENKTISVQNELISERRVRRDLEENLKKTRNSIQTLGHRLEKVTVPVDDRMTRVEEVFFSSLESLNRTLFEDHLNKLYYKVDGVVYQNETRHLDERLNQVETEIKENINVNNSTDLIQLAEEVKSLSLTIQQINESIKAELTPRLLALEAESVRAEEMETLENKLMEMYNVSEMLRNNMEVARNGIEESKSFQQKMQNVIEEWISSLSDIKNQVVELQLRKKEIEENAIITEKNKPENSNSTCPEPNIYSPHLLAVVERDDDTGSQSLIFGCRPLGRYILSSVPVPARCENGSWHGPFPNCIKLLDELEIRTLTKKLEGEKLCLNASGTFPDPTNCSRFLVCSNYKVTVMHCPENLHFNAHKRQCVYPINSGCATYANLKYTSELLKLRDLIPAISLDPNNLDKPYGLMGTDAVGHMIVYPGTTFSMNCLYPENVFGRPHWSAYYFESYTNVEKISNNSILSIPAAAQEHSGVYTCRTPYGKEHSITINVKAVECPSITNEEELEEAVFYRPTPEGYIRILSTVAQFQCEDGHAISAMCLANGTWSRGVPKPEECEIRSTRTSSLWGCPALDTMNHPHLIIEKMEHDMRLTFKCAGGRRLVGPSYTTCTDEKQWSHVTLPQCQELKTSYFGVKDTNGPFNYY